jgi:MerR family transcriptional regulator/heat shock protein HspR
MTTYYTRKQVLELLEIDEGFLVALEREDVISGDAPADAAGEFSERMLERVRVATNLVGELEVNVPGVSIIVRMREEMADLRRHVEELLAELERRGGRR